MEEFNLNDLVETKEEAEFKENKDLMKNRRWMAYFSLIAITVFALFLIIALFFAPQVLDLFGKVEDMLGTIVLGFFGIIALYFGANSLVEVLANKPKK
jgi:uncharacterized membrane protein